MHELLEEKATKLEPGANGLLALDWHNGSVFWGRAKRDDGIFKTIINVDFSHTI